MKKEIMIALISVMSAISLFAGTVNLGWNPITDPSVTTVKVYAVPGTNTVFTAGNANATVIRSVNSTNSTISITNLQSSAWTFTATALSSGGIESTNSNVVWANVPPSGVVNLQINSVTVP
jgi:hypothetical protein